MYPEELIAPMRAELANNGYTETKTPDEVTAAINADGTTFVVVNSVCRLVMKKIHLFKIYYYFY